MKLITVLLVAHAVSATTLGLQTFNLNDVKHFLHDRKVEFDELSPLEELSVLAEREVSRLKGEQKNRRFTVDVGEAGQQVLLMATNTKADLHDIFPHNWDYLEQQLPATKLKDWVFELWSTTGLQDFLKANKVKFSKKAPRQDLIDIAKSHYDDIVKSVGVSGTYPGEWLYRGWSTETIKLWLADHELDFDPSETKSDLLQLVKDNNYIASLSSIDNKQLLLDLLHLDGRNVFDSTGKIAQGFYDLWLYSQLREWLYYHGVISTKPSLDSDSDLDLGKLKKLAKSHERYLEADIKSWLDTAKQKGDPFLSKKPDAKDRLAEYVNDTFLVGIDRWSKARLQEFLRVRGVNYPKLATRDQLVKLARLSKDVAVRQKNEGQLAGLLSSWSTDSIRDWLKDQGQAIEGTRQDLVRSVSGFFEDSSRASSLSAQAHFKLYRPDLDEYRKYVEKKTQKGQQIAEDSLSSSYEVGLEYYDAATKAVAEKYKEGKFLLDEALDQVQEAAYEYSSSLIGDLQKGHTKVQNNVEAANIAATDFVGLLSSRLHEEYQNKKPIVEDYLEKTQKYIKHLGDAIEQQVHHHKPKVEGALKDAHKAVSDSYNDYQPKVQDAVEQAASHALVAYESAANTISSAYGEYLPKVQDAYDSAAESAQSAYGEYKPVIEEAAKNTYDAAVKYGSEAGDYVQEKYGEYRPKFDEAVASAYEYLLDTYSNTDLRAYLQSFGFDSALLADLSRYQLVQLSRAQSSLFYGKTSKWDKLLGEVLLDASDNFQKLIGWKKKSLWDQVKSSLGM